MSGDGLRAHLIRGGLGSAGIQATSRLLALGLGIMLARMLGPEGYGVYAYAFAIMSLLMVAAEAGVPTLLMREIAASQGREEWGLLRGALRRGGQFVAMAATAVALLGLLGLLLLWKFADPLRPEVLYTTALMLLLLPVSALCKTVDHAMRGLHRIVIGQAVDILIRPLLVLVIVGVVFLVWPEQRQPQVAMAAQLLGALAVLFIGVLVLRRFLPHESRTAVPEYQSHQWLKSALPFALIGGAGIINNQTDIIMLGWFMESEDVGIYRVVSQGAIFITFVLQAASSVLGPSFSKMFARKDFKALARLYKKSTVIIFILTTPFFSALILEDDNLLGALFGQSYVRGAPVLTVLSAGYFVNIAFGAIGLLLQMTGQEKFTAYALWVTSILNIFMHIALIPWLGLMGAAIATSLTVISYHAVLWVRYMQLLKVAW